MKYILIMLLFASACKKLNQEEYVTAQTYVTNIKYANYNEPDKLYWYIYQESERLFYYTTTTDLKRDLSTLEWYKVSAFPSVLQMSGQRLNDVTVLKIIIMK